MKKQTAANNEFLAACKRLFNVPIFKRVSEIMNDSTVADRDEAVRSYLVSVGCPTDPAALLAKIGR